LTAAFALPAGIEPVPVIGTDGRAIVLDLSCGSMALGEPLSGLPVERFTELVERRMAEAGTGYAYGRWGERRDLYGNDLFASGDPAARRDVHLGIDVFCRAGTPVRAPLPGIVHLMANNARELDYGPLVILEHTLGDRRFFSLYGHLSLDSLTQVETGAHVDAGDTIAFVGSPPDNGNWSPHLHFQLILDLLGLGAEFPGVANAAERARWFALSPLPGAFFADCDASSLDGRASI
jgi:murein DD-endopeptidase MepM/ murein hydrolase activator NlpD